ncbi:SDR family oxidoreductase [Aliiglaciecola sp. LCG003]|uniref:SDR family oxidoreductase n=1 Tax=Aliiglaciecola sp. LCG003 TaxID=3053655 RepID=UPI0025735215|nr:SDR family oxidoreductase [Aliiglaciecola sp. LCG003]WJG08549.1 SDR family oxidoreductase [Aliiglaciecola sp. LCG003]
MSNSNRNIVITGAASGLGRALALGYAAPKVSICVVDLNKDDGLAVVDLLKDKGCDAWYQNCDITQQKDVDELTAAIQNKWQHVDLLINNAGVATAGALAFEDIEQWQWVLNINLLGMVRVTRSLIDCMPNPSKIINIASQAGITPIPLMASYNASKAAVVSFSETMHLELAPKGVQVSVACPSFFPTNLDKSLRSKQPGIDKVVSKLLSRSDLSATQVAATIIQQADAGRFMIITHKAGKTAYNLKRFLPIRSYLNMIKRKTRQLSKIRESK